MERTESDEFRPANMTRPPADTGGLVDIPLLAHKTRKRTTVTVPVTDGASPGKTSSQRVKVVVGYTTIVDVAKGFPTPEEILAAAAPVLACRGRGHHHSRHRRHLHSGWLCLVTQVLGAWAPTFRVCLVVAVSTAAVIGAFVTTGPEIAASLGSLLTGLTALAIWTACARRVPEPRL
jgi:hypothetical protein